MEKLPQLFMRRENLNNLPPLALPYGYSLMSHTPEKENGWKKLVTRAFGREFSFQEAIVEAGGYKPEHVLYLEKNGSLIATATAAEIYLFPGEGWLRMIGVDPDSRGVGAGRLICVAALQSLAARGYKTAALATDDFRTPAIKLYLSLGFNPIYTHESHEERWKKVLETIMP